LATPQKTTKKKAKKKKEWLGTCVGWLFVLILSSIIIYAVVESSGGGRLVCNTLGREVSLTTFGSCRTEPQPFRRKSSFFSFWKRILL
jgi:hypothetical protein